MSKFRKTITFTTIGVLSALIAFSQVPNSHATTIVDDLLTGDDMVDIDFLGGKVRRGSDHPFGPNHPNTPGSQGGVIPKPPPPPPAVPPQPGWCKSSTIAGIVNMCNTPGCTAGYAVDTKTGNVIVHPCTSTGGGNGPTMPNSCTANNSGHANTVCKSCAGGIVSWKNGGNIVFKKCPPGSYKPPKKTSLEAIIGIGEEGNGGFQLSY